MDTDKFNYLPATTPDPAGKYVQPKNIPCYTCGGYPNEVPNTQTLKTRGTGAAIKGTKSSTKMG
jgi:hypothetical protein